MSPESTRRANLASGLILIGLVIALGAWFGVRKMLQPAPEQEHTYVAYFENAGGIRAGDRVRLKGRSAGRVTDVRIVQREGRTLARVEFVIAPGEGSQWLNERNLSIDTEVRVQRPRLMGSTQLSISPGSDERTVASGGELTRVVNDKGTDQLLEFKQQLVEFNQYLDQAMKYLDSPLVEKAMRGLAELNRRAVEMEEFLERGMASAPDLMVWLDDSRRRLEELRRQVKSGVDNLPGQIAEADRQVNELSDGMQRLANRLATLSDDLAQADTAVLELRKASGGDAANDAGRGFRRMAAQVRESMALSVLNPAKFGDMPSWRKLRKHYHGNTFKPGDGSEKYED